VSVPEFQGSSRSGFQGFQPFCVSASNPSGLQNSPFWFPGVGTPNRTVERSNAEPGTLDPDGWNAEPRTVERRTLERWNPEPWNAGTQNLGTLGTQNPGTLEPWNAGNPGPWNRQPRNRDGL